MIDAEFLTPTVFSDMSCVNITVTEAAPLIFSLWLFMQSSFWESFGITQNKKMYNTGEHTNVTF